MELVYSNNRELVGSSEAITNIARAIKLLEGRDFKVALISGEVGTQKNTVARILHHNSARRNRPMLTIDCNAVSGPWIESALDSNNPTGFLGNQKGILCLQNIELLSLKAQGSLLRLLEQATDDGESLSLIAVTTTDLKKAVKESRFILEFYEYLSRFHVHMPALKDRASDIAPLAKKILKEISTTFHTKMTQIDPEVLEICCNYEWPGNLRQLHGMLEQVAVFFKDELTFRPEFLPPYFNTTSPLKVITVSADMKLPRQGVVLEDLEKSLLKQALEQMLGNQSRAARLLGISRFALRYRMEKYGLFPRTKEEISAAANDEWGE